MKTDEFDKDLFVAQSDQYGDKYVEHLIEQYKIYINSAEKISDRRLEANKFFLGINTALVALLGFVAARDQVAAPLSLSSLGGIAVCYLWYRMVLSYKGLNAAKFKVIHTIEKRLPLALYHSEWEALGRGESKDKYWPFTHIELWVPRVFMLIYTATLFYAVYIKFR